MLGVGGGKGEPTSDSGEPAPEHRAMEGISELNAEAEAYFDRGYNYYGGDGDVSQDYAEALKWIRKVAARGEPAARSQLTTL